ncbi:Glutathione peroxidase [Sergentomyia squamirostris]
MEDIADKMSTLPTPRSIFDYSVVDVNGNQVTLDQYKGKVCLIVNIASNDDTTLGKFKQLDTLNRKYEDHDFAILLFPCSQFGARNSMQEIMNMIEREHLRVGELFHEIDVNGSKTSELYKYLKGEKPGNMGGFINCNFTIFVIDRMGYPMERLTPNVHPYVLEDTIEKFF